MQVTVDFHVHSTASDGTESPGDIVRTAAARGFAALALTDHDNVDGIAEFVSEGRRLGLRVVPGIELSVDPGLGFDRFHLLGLGVDPADAALKAFLARVLEGRNERNKRIVSNFARLGIRLGDDIGGYAHGDVLARPHFANWLVDHGLASSPAEAFARYLLPDSPIETRCYERRYRPSPEEAFAVVHGAGGLCVMAHPRCWRREWACGGCDFDVAAEGLAALKERGLDGVEALYQANLPEENVEFTRIAARLGLMATAGSDFHGRNKPSIALGMEVSDGFADALLERLD